MSPHIVVVHDADDVAHGAVRHGLALARSTTGGRCTVLHTASVGVTVRNGPTAAIAEQLGRPGWAMVHTEVIAIGADPDSTDVIVASDPVERLVARYAPDATAIVLGPHRRPSIFGGDPAARLADAVGVPVLRAPRRAPATVRPRATVPPIPSMERVAA